MSELRTLRSLRTPARIQDYLQRISVNFETKGETCRSPRRVLRDRTAHCLEGALLAAAAFLVRGEAPLLLDLKATQKDSEHVVALFRRAGKWGAISKTNHVVLRYREPVYASIRELAMSYFHEYFLDSGEKTMRSFSKTPLDMRKFIKKGWTTDERDLWYVSRALDALPHERIANPAAIREFRKADPIERRAGMLTDWKKPSSRYNDQKP